MCGRYYVPDEDSAADLREIIEQINRRANAGPVVKTGEIAPSDVAPVLANALFRDGMRHRRCLVPAAHYFEWEKRGKDRIKYAIRPGGAAVMYMAGIYRLENGAPVFTILTREPAAAISFIHDRMPVILPKEAVSDWLNIRYDARDVLAGAVQDVECWLA